MMDEDSSTLPVPIAVGGTKLFARVLIVDRRARFLCVRQRGPRHEFWTFPGGKVEPGERPDTAARREVAEEIGVTLGFIHFVVARSMRVAHTRWRGLFYFSPEMRGEPCIGEPDKITDLKFLSPQEMRAGGKRSPISAAVADYFLKVAVGRDLLCRTGGGITVR